jgi:hypothetical protein
MSTNFNQINSSQMVLDLINFDNGTDYTLAHFDVGAGEANPDGQPYDRNATLILTAKAGSGFMVGSTVRVYYNRVNLDTDVQPTSSNTFDLGSYSSVQELLPAISIQYTTLNPDEFIFSQPPTFTLEERVAGVLKPATITAKSDCRVYTGVLTLSLFQLPELVQLESLVGNLDGIGEPPFSVASLDGLLDGLVYIQPAVIDGLSGPIASLTWYPVDFYVTPESLPWNQIAQGNNAWVFADRQNARIALSREGKLLREVETSLDPLNDYTGLAFGNGVFVRSIKNSTNAAISVDGETWSLVALPASDDWQKVFFTGTYFVMFAAFTGYTLVSENGTDWFPLAILEQSYSYFIVGNNTALLYSADLTSATYFTGTWLTRSAVTVSLGRASPNYNQGTYGDGKFLIVDNAAGSFVTSTDAVVWTSKAWEPPVDGQGISSPLAYVAEYGFLAVISNNAGSLHSSNGLFWNYSSLFPGDDTALAGNLPRSIYAVQGNFYTLSRITGRLYTTALTVGALQTIDLSVQAFLHENTSAAALASGSGYSVVDNDPLLGPGTVAVARYTNPATEAAMFRLLPWLFSQSIYAATKEVYSCVFPAGTRIYNKSGVEYTAQQVQDLASGVTRPPVFSRTDTGASAEAFNIELPASSSFAVMVYTQDRFSDLPDTANFVAGLDPLYIADSVTLNNSATAFKVTPDTGALPWRGQIISGSPASGYSPIIFGNGRYISKCTSTNEVAFSTDGITWELYATALPINMVAGTFGNGVFVMVGYDSPFAFISMDGLVWLAAGLNLRSDWTSVAFGQGMFLATTRQGVLATSSNGVYWTISNIPDNTLPDNGAQVRYLATSQTAGYFVLLKPGTSICYRSTDGVNWTAYTIGFVENWIEVLYANSLFVFLSNGQDLAYTSGDWTSWNIINTGLPPATLAWTSAATDGSSIVLVNGANYAIGYVGQNWILDTPRPIDSQDAQWVVFLNKTHYYAGGSGIGFMRSKQLDPVTMFNWSTVVALGTPGGELRNSAALSSGFDSSLQPNWVSVANTAGVPQITLGQSTGFNWQALAGRIGDPAFNYDYFKIVYAAGQYVLLMGESGDPSKVTIALSADGGLNWTSTNYVFPVIPTAICYSVFNGLLVVVGAGGFTGYAAVGGLWTFNIIENHAFSCVAANNSNGIMALSTDGYLARSTDAVNWVVQAMPLANTNGAICPWLSIVWKGSRYVAIASNGYAGYSFGIGWTLSALPPQTAPYVGLAAYDFNSAGSMILFAALCANGNLAISREGLSWSSEPTGVSAAGGVARLIGGNNNQLVITDQVPNQFYTTAAF